MASLRCSGTARLIFYPDQDLRFEGVLITKDTGETLGIIGRVSECDPNILDIQITDGETGEVYIVRRVQLISAHRHGSNRILRKSSASMPGSVLKNGQATMYALKSDTISFATKEILVGRKGDKEIAAYMRADLVGKHISVHMGNMELCVCPPVTPRDNQNGKHSWRTRSNGNCGDNNSNECIDNKKPDAEVNFLM